MFDPQAIKADFPILSRKVHGKPLVYLDNAATSQKPQAVLDAITEYYMQHNANVHRGVHQLSDESTQIFEDSRKTIADFFGATSNELVVTRNTTEAINGVAYGWADHNLKSGDTILVTRMEHHSNLVVWQQVCQRTGAKLEIIELDENGRIDWADFRKKLRNIKVKLICVPHVSNALGTLNPVKDLIKEVRLTTVDARQPLVLVDGAQSAPHIPINFDQLGADFFIFSGHKMLGPMGVGGLLVRKELLESGEMRPWLFGGGMIAEVHDQSTVFHPELDERFIAGTPDVASVAGLAAACEYLTRLGMKQVEDHDRKLVAYALDALSEHPSVKVAGPTIQQPNAEQLDRIGSVAFTYDGVHAHDVAQVLDSEGVAVRSGHHCTMPLHAKMGWAATVRLSFQVYNAEQDIDALVAALHKVASIFTRS